MTCFRFLCAFVVLVIVLGCAARPVREDRRILEWGWNTPRLQQLEAHLPAAQSLPFDGIIWDVATPADARGLSWTLFGDQPVDTEQLESLAAEYAGLEWGRLTDNFLRLTVFPADVDWFADWTTIYQNAQTWADFARRMGSKGIMLDVEQYNDAHLFDYSRQANAQTRSFDAYSEQAVARGREFMDALEAGFPGLTVLYTYALTVEPPDAPIDWTTHRYGLLIPFVEGMAAAADTGTVLVDGYEHAYIFQAEAQFQAARAEISGVGPRYVEDAAFRRPQVGFGLWLDPVCGSGGLPEEGCGFTPDGFRTALSHALQYSDRYVWIYSQRINWYTGEGIPGVWQTMMQTFR